MNKNEIVDKLEEAGIIINHGGGYDRNGSHENDRYTEYPDDYQINPDYVVVPREPTEEMAQHILGFDREWSGYDVAVDTYKAMIKAGSDRLQEGSGGEDSE